MQQRAQNNCQSYQVCLERVLRRHIAFCTAFVYVSTDRTYQGDVSECTSTRLFLLLRLENNLPNRKTPTRGTTHKSIGLA